MKSSNHPSKNKSTYLWSTDCRRRHRRVLTRLPSLLPPPLWVAAKEVPRHSGRFTALLRSFSRRRTGKATHVTTSSRTSPATLMTFRRLNREINFCCLLTMGLRTVLSLPVTCTEGNGSDVDLVYKALM